MALIVGCCIEKLFMEQCHVITAAYFTGSALQSGRNKYMYSHPGTSICENKALLKLLKKQ